jgi:dolichol-phosphate mannosyltransferase
VHLAALSILHKGFHVDFIYAQAFATLTAMTSNFLLNNWLTYRDKRLRGFQIFTGWLSFCALCSVGALANVGVATYLFQAPFSWWIAGIAGVLVGVVWNYVATALFTWRD